MSFRIATKKDLPIIEFIENSSGYHEKRIDFKSEAIRLFNNKNIILLAEERKNSVGYISFSQNGEINFLAVITSKQNKGIAKKLLSEVIKKAKRLKLKKLFLEVKIDNFKAIALYIKHGFAIQKIIQKDYQSKKIIKLKMIKIL